MKNWNDPYVGPEGAARLLWPLLAGFLRVIVAIGGSWLALRLTGSVNWLFAALAFGLIVYGIALRRRSHRGRGLVESDDEHSYRFCVIALSSNGCSTSTAAHGAGAEKKLFIGKLSQRAEGNQKVDARDPALKNRYRRTRLTDTITMAR